VLSARLVARRVGASGCLKANYPTRRTQWSSVQYDRPEEELVQLRDLQARIKRLEELSRGFALEAIKLKKGEGEFLHLERVRYVSAIQDAQRWVERARVALAQVCTRLEEKERSRLQMVTEE
jgi:hypothetical protein